jgi:glyoxylase-like metal-dependent hydrolase (beta-lactamase superfamily II)
MLITKPGKVTERITLLGRLESCVYIVDGGTESVLIGGSMAYVVPDIVQQIADFGIDEEKINRLVIQHSHFDHCGAIPYLKKRWPGATVTASARAKDILSDPKVSQSIAVMNQQAIARAGLENKADELGLGYGGIVVEETVGGGDRISCGDLTMEVIDVPGHSSCSIALYIPSEKALFTSDAAGVRYKESYLAAGNSNYDFFQKSLEKMALYDVDVLLGEHYGAFTGENARSFLPLAIEAAKRTRTQLEESYRRTQDIKKSTEEMTDVLLKDTPPGFMPREVMALIAGQMVKYIAKTIDK